MGLKVINSGWKWQVYFMIIEINWQIKNLIEPVPPNNFDSWDQSSRYTHIYLFLFASKGSGYLSNNVLILLSIKN